MIHRSANSVPMKQDCAVRTVDLGSYFVWLVITVFIPAGLAMTERHGRMATSAPSRLQKQLMLKEPSFSKVCLSNLIL